MSPLWAANHAHGNAHHAYEQRDRSLRTGPGAADWLLVAAGFQFPFPQRQLHASSMERAVYTGRSKLSNPWLPASSFRQRQLHASSMERAAMRFTRRLYSRLSPVNRRAASAFAGLCSASTGQFWHHTA